MAIFIFDTIEELHEFFDRASEDLTSFTEIVDPLVKPIEVIVPDYLAGEAYNIVERMISGEPLINVSNAELAAQIDELKESGGVNLKIETSPVYEYRDIWAEESGRMSSKQVQWSFGNGATGYCGLPIDDGWHVCGFYFQTEYFYEGSKAEMQLVDMRGKKLTEICSIDIDDSTLNNNVVSIYVDLSDDCPVVPQGACLGFYTKSASGSINDARVGVRLRRVAGEFVSGVSLVEVN